MAGLQTLHPMVVHFPIALLSLYALLEVISLHPRLKYNTSLAYTKMLLLFAGTVSAMVATSTWEGAEHQLGESTLIDRHAFYSEMARNAFLILSIIYLVKIVFQSQQTIIRSLHLPQQFISGIAVLLSRVSRLYVPVILACIWLFLITIAGALGGAIVHWAGIDPVVQWVVNNFAS